jgi:antitoxin component YwqK of YwqJK toxin-antitoxin module
MKYILLFGSLMCGCLFYSCEVKKAIVIQKISADTAMLDSIKGKADTSFLKKYPRTDFTTATYYINYNDSTITQVMRDNKDMIRQIIIERKKVRIYTAAFYANGQLMAKYNLDSFGQFSDSSKAYYENGYLKSEGIYKNGFHFGKWKNYDSTGKYINTEQYNKDGQQIKNAD